jgi:hypothetical protein
MTLADQREARRQFAPSVSARIQPSQQDPRKLWVQTLVGDISFASLLHGIVPLAIPNQGDKILRLSRE